MRAQPQHVPENLMSQTGLAPATHTLDTQIHWILRSHPSPCSFTILQYTLTLPVPHPTTTHPSTNGNRIVRKLSAERRGGEPPLGQNSVAKLSGSGSTGVPTWKLTEGRVRRVVNSWIGSSLLGSTSSPTSRLAPPELLRRRLGGLSLE